MATLVAEDGTDFTGKEGYQQVNVYSPGMFINLDKLIVIYICMFSISEE